MSKSILATDDRNPATMTTAVASKYSNAVVDWSYDTGAVKAREVRLYAIAASVATLFAFACLGVAFYTISAKQYFPFAVRVDEANGIVDVITELKTVELTESEAITVAHAGKYIRWREGYVFDTYPVHYKRAVKMSQGRARDELVRYYAPDRSKSPMITHGVREQRNVRFKSFSHLSDNSIAVRYALDIVRQDKTLTQHYVTTVTYSYSTDSPVSLDARIDNTFGFVVVNYQVAKEGTI